MEITMRKLFTAAAVAAVLACSFQAPAQAAPTDLGAITGTKVISSVTKTGTFADLWHFSTPLDSAAGFATTSIKFSTGYGIEVQSMQVFLGAFADEASLNGLTPVSLPAIKNLVPTGANPVANDTRFSTYASLLESQVYTLAVTGKSNGVSTYTGLIAISPLNIAPPVPEPETYAMLAAGLGMMGFIARRRQKNR
ncbi:FxDxF family PEP-CTERM protein [Xylophilus sp. GOD-11R]|uniref:FxDxF family PEP-CTERM protein n=1 Tax=Xylophilus sp. GOD-11R TaxID=3089814 RepID=UPI00298BD88B|nr:FxDxF family PEP-CTERM protein [Xylophilus sp. GOD-11R]WPB57921.1 FxDxF family PEP-CTERM protein [Xylophilus sp. GOD-11R]